MIEQLLLMWVGTMAIGLTFGGLTVAVPEYDNNEGSLVGIIAFAFAFMFWALFTLHSTGYMVVLGSGVSMQNNAGSLMIVGIIGGLTTLLLLFDAAMRTIKAA